MTTAIEKLWPAVAPQLLTANGTANGVVTVANSTGFKVKQNVILVATGLPDKSVKIMRFISPTQFYVGPTEPKAGQGLTGREDISAYTVAAGAYVYAAEQPKVTVKPEDIFQAVYRQEPGTTIGVEIDDKWGNPIDSVVDNHGINRLAVDGQFHAEVDVQVDVDVDGYYDPVTNPDPDNIGLIGHARSNPTDQTDQTQRITAKRGTVDTDTVSQDVSLHDQNGNQYTPLNPVPVSTAYEKFFALIAASKWMQLADYTEVIPDFSGTTMTLTFKEDEAILGTAVVTNYTSNTGWSLKLNRFIDDDDGTILLDDDGSSLNLD